ncbi:MAG: bifunctional UDP-N-acetylmuramoyl-tripeptide:D-alanyl-D-alanine ligase/alanine racemase [Taibaiella sp.]|nr:bifunctional UDP-N-acetylmuramoyl-tripeptide:D-alanyl-D-alanine ligase/alanine racemase [Taibaiella sp.]
MPHTLPSITTALLREWCNGQWLAQAEHEETIEWLAIDSRRIADEVHTLFIALSTSLRDGHTFIADCYNKGVRSFLVSKQVDVASFPGASFILVKDTLTAAQQIATRYRKLFTIPVIGVTGSNGKTIVKEWLYQLLSPSFTTVRSPKSYNSQIGVPLSVWLLEPETQLGIFEAGISQPGEMDKLEHIIRPTIGVFTNAGEAHSEGFLNMRQKINEKLLLFRNAEHLVYCRDHHELNECVSQYVNNIKHYGTEANLKLFTWSQKQDADMRITAVNKKSNQTFIEAAWQQQAISISIPFTDNASVENAIHCWCILLLMGIAQHDIAQRMHTLQPVSMRLELRQGINDCTIINDTYNSDLTSFQIALDYLGQQKQHHHHTVILSDMQQIGKPPAELYDEVANLIGHRSIYRFIGIGPALYKNKSAFRKHKKLRSIFFKTTDEFLKNIHLLTFTNEAVLLKGARAFAFEKISLLLEQKIHQTVLSINLSSLTHNLNVFRAHLLPGVRTMAMVKAFAYGSGTYEIASVLQFSGIDYLSVAYTDEGIMLRKAGVTLPIMVMSPEAIAFDRMIAWKLEPEIYNFRSLQAFTDMAHTLGVLAYPIHIKLDTGMHRLGFMPGEMDDLTAQIADNPHVHIASIFSHLAASDDSAQDEFTLQQAALLEQMAATLTKALTYKPLLHIANSAAIVRHPRLQMDMVRLGLGLYGIDGTGILHDQLRQIGTLKTTIAQVKDIPAGDTIGYNRSAVATTPMRIAVISIGYADGYPRSMGNGNAYVLVQGRQAPTVGIICMDMCMIDITHIPEAKEGDDVIIFSPALPVTLLATWSQTIPYEIMTGISQRVKRVYVNEE